MKTDKYRPNAVKRLLIAILLPVMAVMMVSCGKKAETKPETKTEPITTAVTTEASASATEQTSLPETSAEITKTEPPADEPEQTSASEEQTTAAEEVTETETETETVTETEAATETEKYTVYRFRNKKLLDQHYEKHGKEMGFRSAKDYEAAASDVINSPDALFKLEAEDGDGVYYIEETNEFAILSTDGYIRTYFLPSGGRKYFDRQ